MEANRLGKICNKNFLAIFIYSYYYGEKVFITKATCIPNIFLAIKSTCIPN